MPPVAAVATAITSAAAAAASTVVAAIGPTAIGTALGAPAATATATGLTAYGLGVGGYQVVKSTSEAEKVRSQAASQFAQQQAFTERQAGEYYQLSTQQMELQAQASQITTLANLITEARRPAAPQVFTLPPAKEYSAVEQINQAIDKMLRG